MKKAIFLYNDGTSLPKQFHTNLNPNDKMDEDLLSKLKNLYLHGYKIIQFIPSPTIEIPKDYGTRSLNYSINKNDTKASIILREFYYDKHMEHNLEYTIKLIQYASEVLNIDCSKSYVLGNTLNIMEAGNCLGLCSILIDNDKEKDWIFAPGRTPNYFVKDLNNAINNIKISKESIIN